jgi:hypothetical protein
MARSSPQIINRVAIQEPPELWLYASARPLEAVTEFVLKIAAVIPKVAVDRPPEE